jgi:hypothetical protein
MLSHSMLFPPATRRPSSRLRCHRRNHHAPRQARSFGALRWRRNAGQLAPLRMLAIVGSSIGCSRRRGGSAARVQWWRSRPNGVRGRAPQFGALRRRRTANAVDAAGNGGQGWHAAVPAARWPGGAARNNAASDYGPAPQFGALRSRRNRAGSATAFAVPAAAVARRRGQFGGWR